MVDEQIERYLNTCERYRRMPESLRRESTMRFALGMATKLVARRTDLMQTMTEQDVWLYAHPRHRQRDQMDAMWIDSLQEYERVETALTDGTRIMFGGPG